MSALETKNRLAAAATLRIEFPGAPSGGEGFIDYRAISGFENRVRTWQSGAFTNGLASVMCVLPLGRQYSRNQTVISASGIFGIAGAGAAAPERTTYPQPNLSWQPPRPSLVVAHQAIPEAALETPAGGGPNWLPFGLTFPDPFPLPAGLDPDLFDAIAIYIDDGTQEVGIGPYDVSVMLFELPPNEAGAPVFENNIPGPFGGP